MKPSTCFLLQSDPQSTLTKKKKTLKIYVLPPSTPLLVALGLLNRFPDQLHSVWLEELGEFVEEFGILQMLSHMKFFVCLTMQHFEWRNPENSESEKKHFGRVEFKMLALKQRIWRYD